MYPARSARPHIAWLSIVGAMVLLSGFAVMSTLPSEANAAKSGSCSSFAVSTGGQTFRGDQDRVIPAGQVGPTIKVRGTSVELDVVSSTFTVRDYTLTGAPSGDPDKDLPVNGPTVVFESKVPNHGETLNSALEIDLNNEGVVLERSGGGQDMKIQAKDCPQGGLFQMEPEPSITETNTLGPGFTYENGTPGQTSPLCFSNGRFAGYDSPELATLVRSTDKVATWRVQSGGRVGGVLGEDALEEGCTP